ncbi:hypothetical protein PV04_07363 [Phialophora macrospora]|uniref:Uncharacterized protein n=1 Tax=Phialophora macrospora TaxID=1851006 RepID=A0A0D2FYX2_9EURO|nr:hypothetical protein PV04_07363 [Phialophora macrospora]
MTKGPTRRHNSIRMTSSPTGRNWKELEGTQASQALLEKKPPVISELPANEEIIDKARLKEMPSNEPTGYEMETTENEMAALDRMAKMTDSTTLGSGNSSSLGPSAS